MFAARNGRLGDDIVAQTNRLSVAHSMQSDIPTEPSDQRLVTQPRMSAWSLTYQQPSDQRLVTQPRMSVWGPVRRHESYGP